jgi:hypothetical protein
MRVEDFVMLIHKKGIEMDELEKMCEVIASICEYSDTVGSGTAQLEAAGSIITIGIRKKKKRGGAK